MPRVTAVDVMYVSSCVRHCLVRWWLCKNSVFAVCLCSHLQNCGRRCALREIQLIETVLWGRSLGVATVPVPCLLGILHSSCSTATIVTFPLAGVCIVLGPPAFCKCLGFYTACHRGMFLQLSFAGQCKMCSHKSVLAGLLMALTLKNMFQYLSFDRNWVLLCVACLGYTKRPGR